MPSNTVSKHARHVQVVVHSGKFGKVQGQTSSFVADVVNRKGLNPNRFHIRIDRDQPSMHHAFKIGAVQQVEWAEFLMWGGARVLCR